MKKALIDVVIKNNRITDIIELETKTRIPKITEIVFYPDDVYVTAFSCNEDGSIQYTKKFNWNKLRYYYEGVTVTRQYYVNSIFYSNDNEGIEAPGTLKNS